MLLTNGRSRSSEHLDGLNGRDYLTETDYAAWSGTSMATPHVAGSAALVFAKHPDWSSLQVKTRLTSTAQRLAAMGKKKRTPAYGTGLLDLKASLK